MKSLFYQISKEQRVSLLPFTVQTSSCCFMAHTGGISMMANMVLWTCVPLLLLPQTCGVSSSLSERPGTEQCYRVSVNSHQPLFNQCFIQCHFLTWHFHLLSSQNQIFGPTVWSGLCVQGSLTPWSQVSCFYKLLYIICILHNMHWI